MTETPTAGSGSSSDVRAEVAELINPWQVYTASDGYPALRTIEPELMVERLIARPDLLVRLAVESGALRPMSTHEGSWADAQHRVRTTGPNRGFAYVSSVEPSPNTRSRPHA